jgi:apolipoprotein N-acyltransferase
MKHRTAQAERRRGLLWLVFGVLFLAAMFGMWWLVESTNKEGEHDAQLLPFFALIPLLLGAYHLIRSRFHHA